MPSQRATSVTMAQNQQTHKSKWGVGAFFQQAVAGVESRLDNILLDDEERQKASGVKPVDNGTTGASVNRSPAGCMIYMLNIGYMRSG